MCSDMWARLFGDNCCVQIGLYSAMGQSVTTLERIINMSLALAKMGVLYVLICVLCVNLCFVCVNLYFVCINLCFVC